MCTFPWGLLFFFCNLKNAAHFAPKRARWRTSSSCTSSSQQPRAIIHVPINSPLPDLGSISDKHIEHNHANSPLNLGLFLTHLSSRYDRYGYKVWLTEFSCGDGAQKKPTVDHLGFMREVLPMLDAADYVFRCGTISA